MIASEWCSFALKHIMHPWMIFLALDLNASCQKRSRIETMVVCTHAYFARVHALLRVELSRVCVATIKDGACRIVEPNFAVFRPLSSNSFRLRIIGEINNSPLVEPTVFPSLNTLYSIGKTCPWTDLHMTSKAWVISSGETTRVNALDLYFFRSIR